MDGDPLIAWCHIFKGNILEIFIKNFQVDFILTSHDAEILIRLHVKF